MSLFKKNGSVKACLLLCKSLNMSALGKGKRSLLGFTEEKTWIEKKVVAVDLRLLAQMGMEQIPCEWSLWCVIFAGLAGLKSCFLLWKLSANIYLIYSQNASIWPIFTIRYPLFTWFSDKKDALICFYIVVINCVSSQTGGQESYFSVPNAKNKTYKL